MHLFFDDIEPDILTGILVKVTGKPSKAAGRSGIFPMVTCGGFLRMNMVAWQ